jgi:hypothetical protein
MTPAGFEPENPSTRAATDPRLIHRPFTIYCIYIIYQVYCGVHYHPTISLGEQPNTKCGRRGAVPFFMLLASWKEVHPMKESLTPHPQQTVLQSTRITADQ